MTAPDLTDADRDEYRRLSAQVVEYLTGQGWRVLGSIGIDGALVSPSGLSLQWFGSAMLPWFAVWREDDGITRIQAQVSSAQQAVDYLVVAAILPESMASWAPLVGEAQQIGEGGPDDPSTEGCLTCAHHFAPWCIAPADPVPLTSLVTHCPLWTERS